MIAYNFTESKPSEDFRHGYELWLFQSYDHLILQSPSGWHTFHAVNQKSQCIDAHLHLHFANNVAVSPYKASFGSVQFSKDIKPVVLYNFLEYILSRLKEEGIKTLILKNPPDAYQPDGAALLNTFLVNLGFVVEAAEVGSVIDAHKNFSEGLSPWEERKLKQSRKAGLEFKVESPDLLKTIYAFILDCRQERGYLLSIDWDTLESTVKTFPERFHLFSVSLDNEIIAASISINVGNKVLYNFHSAHPHTHDSLSPVVMLIEGMCRFAKTAGFDSLDLGTSALAEGPNFSLLDFKLGLGGRPTMKLTFRKDL